MKNYLIGAALVLGGVGLTVLLIALSPEPPKEAPPPQTPLVRTQAIEAQQGAVTVRGYGTVRPAVEIDLTAQVGGELVAVSDALVSGGVFEKGQTLARIDPTDYRNAVRRAEATVTQREFEVLQAREEVGIAREEYARLRQRTGDAPAPDSTALGRLVFREPQLRRAEANLESARAALDDARTNLARTTIEAPFRGRVRTERADLGAYVAPGTPVATLYGTDEVELVVPFPSRKAALIDGLWRTATERRRAGIPATVALDYGGERFAWTGYVDRVEGALDEATRTIDVVVRVPDPYAPAGPTVEAQGQEQPPRYVERPPLTLGAYAAVDIEGRTLDRYFTLPRRAVRNEAGRDVVWTVAHDTLLVMRPVRLVQTVDETAYVTADHLAPGTPVITSDLRVVTDSMRVRVSGSSGER